jgi:hypothetical protein
MISRRFSKDTALQPNRKQKQSSMIMDLQHQLSDEKTRRNELETTVANLEGQVKAMQDKSQAHQEDQRLINVLLDIFHLFKKFILVKERRKNSSSYSANFLNATDVEIFAAIDPEPIDLELDNDVTIAYKQNILNIEAETSLFFNNIQVDKAVAYKLNRRLQIRNTETHYGLDNKQMKDVDYVVGHLNFSEKVSEKSFFANEKVEIVKLLNDFRSVYVALAS